MKVFVTRINELSDYDFYPEMWVDYSLLQHLIMNKGVLG